MPRLSSPSAQSSAWRHSARACCPRGGPRASIRSWPCGRSDRMRAIRAALLRLRSLIRRDARNADFSDELESHLRAHIDDNVRAGMTPDEARRDAVLALGGLVPVAEAHRDRRTLPFVEKTMQDLRYAV